MDNTGNFNRLITLLLLKMLLTNQMINHSTYKKAVEYHKRKEMV